MKIGILSDTHIRKGRILPQFVWEALEDVDLILHAGDLTSGSVLEELQILAPVIAVKGNCDWLVEDMPEKVVTELGTLKIGMTHGYLGKAANTPQRAFDTFKEDQVDIIIFGHSHIPYKSFMDGILMFNPGSPVERRGQPHFSMGIMTIDDDLYDIQHLFF